MAELPVALCVHGINYGGEDYASSWQRALWRAGVAVRCVAAPWSSSGTIGGDVWRLLVRRRYRAHVVDEVRRALEKVKPDLIFAHSAGQPITIEAARLAGYDGAVITFGGPLSHPVYGHALRLAGLGERPISADVIHIWNADDGVCCSPTLGVRHPSWIAEHRIAAPGSVGWVREHAAELYLDHPRTAEHVLAAIG